MAKVGDFYNRHKDQDFVIAGNGPSLSLIDLTKIKCPSFGVNRIYLHKTWCPTYYCTESKKFVRHNVENIRLYVGPDFKFVANRCRDYLGTRKLGGPIVMQLRNFVWVNVPKQSDPPEFSTACHKVVNHGMNVVYMAMQLAFYMGARRVILIGVDFDYDDGAVAAKHFYPNELQGDEPVDSTHKEITIEHYKLAHQLFNSGSRPRIVNATPGSKLDVFPKIRFEGLF
jgi:hypothetical protein